MKSKHTHTHTHIHTSNARSQRAEGRVAFGAGLIVTDKRLILLITFNEGATINRHSLTQ